MQLLDEYKPIDIYIHNYVNIPMNGSLKRSNQILKVPQISMSESHL